MPAPLSLDLRGRIVKAYLDNQGTIDEIALRFHVGRATVTRLLGLYRAAQSPDPAHAEALMAAVAPKPHGGGGPCRVRAQDEPLIRAWIEEDPSLTQGELACRYQAATKRPIGQQAMGRTLARMGYTRKKSPSTPQSATERTCGPKARPSAP